MEMNEASFQIIADLLFEHTGQQLTQSRRWRVETALSSVLQDHNLENIVQLTCLIADANDPSLIKDVVEALLNNETYFFRDRPTFDQLPKDILPILAQRRKTSKRLKIWSVGCSTGQEAYSLGMVFSEQSARWKDWSIDIQGTDISQQVIDRANNGHFSQFEVQRGLSVGQMLRHFTETPTGWQLNEQVQKKARFRKHSILDANLNSRPFDLILCRNVLLYFDTATRQLAFNRLIQALAPDGFLMVGAGETEAGRMGKFTSSGSRASILEPVQ